jgi:hypothetical protein
VVLPTPAVPGRRGHVGRHGSPGARLPVCAPNVDEIEDTLKQHRSATIGAEGEHSAEVPTLRTAFLKEVLHFVGQAQEIVIGQAGADRQQVPGQEHHGITAPAGPLAASYRTKSRRVSTTYFR